MYFRFYGCPYNYVHITGDVERWRRADSVAASDVMASCTRRLTPPLRRIGGVEF